MNGAADLGGMMGFGPVIPESEGAPFRTEWEGRVHAMVLAIGPVSRWSIDAYRFAQESLPPGEYLTSSYYEVWMKALEKLLVAQGLVGADELASRRSLRAGAEVRRILRASDVRAALSKRRSYERAVEAAARYAVGDRVRTRNMHPTGHTRLPRYARGKVGVIERVHGAHVLPDTNAHGRGEHPHWLYAVRFAATELWGEGADPTLSVSIDAWESYLQAD
jgi:nitrile hydratase beta subunit